MNNHHMLTSEFMLARVATMTVSSVIIANQSQSSLKVPKALQKVMAVRCMTSLVSLFGIMVAIRTLPLTVFMLIINTNSFTTGLLQYWRLGKPMQTFEVVAMIGCYIGLILIVLGSDEEATRSVGAGFSLAAGFMAAVMAALSISVSSIAIHEMKQLHFAVI